MRSIDLIIFDCDGVLVDSETVSAQVLSACFQEHGISLSAEDCEARFAGVDLAETAHEFAAHGCQAPDDFVETVRVRIFDKLSQGVAPIPGIHDLLAQLSLPYCVASGGKPEKIRLSLRLANLLDRFEPHIFSAFDVGFYKPDPHLFLHAAKTMGVDPANTLVVEDSRVGVQAGVAAGMTVVAYAPTDRTHELRTLGAHHVVDDLGRVLDFLEV